MIDNEANLPRLRALLALGRLSKQLQSDVLADGRIPTAFDIPITRPTRLSNQLVVNSDVLFSAFRNAADGLPIPPILDQNDVPLDNPQVRIESDGSGVITLGSNAWRFPNAALFSGDPVRRLAALDAALRKHTTSLRDTAELRALVARPEYSNEQFIQVIGILSASPETFTTKLREKTAIRQVGEPDLLPEDLRLWENITASHSKSRTLREFIDDELTAERRARLTDDPVRAFESISLTFAAPDLVPRAWFKELDANTVFRMVERSLEFADHFALVGAFEICTDFVARDDRFAEIGDKLLDRLLADMTRLKDACGMFVAVFMIATARLAVHEFLRHRPVYWRRLAAASQASLVVRACGVGQIDHKQLIAWASRISGHEYILSVLNDMAAEPRWRPDWADPRFVAADAFGRLYGAFLALPQEAVPSSWKTRVEAAKIAADADHLNLIMGFPAVLEGARRTQTPSLQDLGDAITGAYREFASTPSVDGFLQLTPVIHAYGITNGINGAIGEVVQRIRRGAEEIDEDATQAVLLLATHVGVLTNDIGLADNIAHTCIELALRSQEPGPLLHLCFRVVECAAANPNREDARIALAKRLELLAFALRPSPAMWSFLNLLETLQTVEPEIAPLLGRAIAAAELAVPRTSAA